MPSPPLSSSLGRSTFFPLWTKFFVNYTVHWFVVVRFKPRIRLLESCYGDWLFIRREREREKLFQSVTSIDRKISFSSSFARVIYPVILCGQDQSRKFNYLVDKSRRFAFFEILWYFDEDNSLLSFINIISANVNMIFSFSRIIRSGFLTSLDVNYIATLLKAWAIFFFWRKSSTRFLKRSGYSIWMSLHPRSNKYDRWWNLKIFASKIYFSSKILCFRDIYIPFYVAFKETFE